MSSILSIINWVIYLINAYLTPLVFAVAFAALLWGILSFFFISGRDPKKREEGRKFIFSSIVVLAIMFSVWGLVNILRFAIPGVQENNHMPPIPTFDASNTQGTGTANPFGNTNTGPAPSQPSNNTGPAPSQPSTNSQDHRFDSVFQVGS